MATPIPQHYIAIDTETTGFLDRKGFDVHRICEFGAAEVKDGKIVASFATKINPQRALSHGASKVNGLIWPAHFMGSPVFADVAGEIAEWLTGGNLPVLASYAAFDRGFIEHEFKLLGVPLAYVSWLDVRDLSRERLPELKSYSQGPVAEHLGVDVSGAHRAARDVEILIAVVERLRTIEPPARKPLAPPPPRETRQGAFGPMTEPEPVATHGAVAALASVAAPADAVAAGKWALTLAPEAPATALAKPFDATAFALAAKGALAPFAVQAAAIVAAVGPSPVVLNDADSSGALAAVGVIRDLGKKAEAARKAILEPLGKPKAEVERYARDEIAKPLAAVEAEILQARESFLLVQRREQEALSVKLAEQAEFAAQAAAQAVFDARHEQADELAASGDAAAAEAAREAATVESEAVYSAAAPALDAYAVGATSTRTATASAVEDLDFDVQVEQPALVPDRFAYRAINHELLLEHVRATGGKEPVAGCVIIPRIRQSVRRR